MWFVYILLFAAALAAVGGLVSATNLFKLESDGRLMFMGAIFVVVTVVFSSAYALSRYATIGDTEIINGEVLDKERVHDSYLRSYSCNCGKNGCQTCTETVYTVTWNSITNIGKIKVADKESTWNSVYRTPNPPFYDMIKRGDPVARDHTYMNYIKAVPDSLWKPAAKDVKAKYAAILPNYPDEIYNHYNIDRVIPVGVTIPNLREWNQKVSETLKTLGPAKQANVVIVVTNQPDPLYFEALRDKWVGGKKNDVVVVIGAPEFPKKAEWVDVMALTEDEMVRTTIKDDIGDLEEITVDGVMSAIKKDVLAHYKRKSMKKFEYLTADIVMMSPFAMTLASIIAIAILIVVGIKLQGDYSPRSYTPYYRKRGMRYPGHY